MGEPPGLVVTFFLRVWLEEQFFVRGSFGVLSVLAMADAIAARAVAVRRPGEFIGFFEWAVWSELRQASVLMLLGTNVVRLRDLLGLAALPSGRPVHYVVAVRGGGKAWRAVRDVRRASHFLIGVAAAAIKVGEGGVRQSDPQSAKAAAFKVGWRLLETNATGDCGPDCMAYWGGFPRNPRGWTEIRGTMADFMVERQADPAWIALYSMCGEVQLAPPPRPGIVSSGSAAAPSAASGSAAQAPSPAVRPPPLPPPSKPFSEDDAMLVGPPGSAQSEKDDAMLAGFVGAPGSAQSEQTFPAWLAALDHDKMLEVTRDYSSYRAAVDTWLQGRPERPKPTPLRSAKRVESRCSYRLATGLRFNLWLVSDVGRASKAPLRDPWC